MGNFISYGIIAGLVVLIVVLATSAVLLARSGRSYLAVLSGLAGGVILAPFLLTLFAAVTDSHLKGELNPPPLSPAPSPTPPSKEVTSSAPIRQAFPAIGTKPRPIEIRHLEEYAPGTKPPSTYMAEAFLLAADQIPIQRYGSFGLIILSHEAEKSLALCSAFIEQFGGRDYRVVVKIDGRVVAIRPVYWPVRFSGDSLPHNTPDCDEVIHEYDFNRVDLIREALNLKGDGPFLLVAKLSKGSVTQIKEFGVYDLELIPVDELGDEFRLFLRDYKDGVLTAKYVSADFRQKLKYEIIAYTPSMSKIMESGVAEAEPVKPR